MKKPALQIILFFLPWLLLAHCSHYYYTPNSQTIPLFREKGEARISGGIYGARESEGFVLNTALAPMDHIAFLGNFMTGDATGNENWGKGNFGEIGIGYYHADRSFAVFECYSGFGFGTITNHYAPRMESEVDYWRYFIQPSFGLRTSLCELAFSSRLCLVAYDNVNIDSELGQSFEYGPVEYIIENKIFFLAEPAVTFRLGSEKFKIQAQMVRSIPLNNDDLKMEEINFNLGFILTF
ncbi:MAG: hypothetical protein JXQ65_12535 [Candidatus Marinimicrobia bacterium]|nr:hypothetical protein [Candidatus Neomarinimicrobiota bacterium]